MHVSRAVSLCSSLFSDTKPCQFQPPWFSWALSSIFGTQVDSWYLPGLPFPVLWPGNSLKAESWAYCRAHLVSCLSGVTSFHRPMSRVLKTAI